MEAEVEIKYVDNEVYMSYWDKNGRSINCHIKNGKIMKFVHSASENEELERQGADYNPFETEEISLDEFINLVKSRKVK